MHLTLTNVACVRPQLLKLILRVMRLTAFILLIMCLQVSARVSSQTVTFSGKNVPLEKLFAEIKMQTGFFVVFNYQMIKSAKPVTIEVKDRPISEVLDLILTNQALEYEIAEKSIVISRKKSALMTADPRLNASFIPIKGRIADESGLPLSGASVSIKGSANSVLTDADGVFTINVPEGELLVISFVGYESREWRVAAANATNLSIVLKRVVSAMDEVVVNKGYYTESQRLSTGSVSKITSKDIEKQPVVNVLAAMQGRMAGVEITQTTGMPGGGFDIRIRGLNSLRSIGNAPLFIVDGVPFASDAIGYSQTSTNLPTPTSPLNTLTPGDIESIEVLKDADATAIYGSRGANGVVLISTKKGRPGKTQVIATASTAIGKITRTVDLLSTSEYIARRKQAFANDGINTYPSDAYDVNGAWDNTRYTDWQKELTGGTAKMTTIQASVSGGSAQTHFLLSANSYNQSSVFPGDFNYKKGGIHVNLDHASNNNRLKVSFSGSYDVQDNDQPSRDLVLNARYLPPNAPALFDAEGKLNWENSTWENPLAALYAKALAKTNSLIANSVITYQLPYGFTAKASLGFTDLHHLETRSNPP